MSKFTEMLLQQPKLKEFQRQQSKLILQLEASMSASGEIFEYKNQKQKLDDDYVCPICAQPF